MKIDAIKVAKRSFLWIELLPLVMVIVFSNAQNNKYTFLTSMQNTNQTFMGYMPLIQNCNYASYPNISPGSITFQTANPQNLFLFYENTEKIAFWSSIENGLDIYMSENVLLSNYSGVIYRPQIFNQDQNYISDNSTSDVISLFKTYSDGNLSIFFVEVEVDANNNFTLTQTILQQVEVNMSATLKNLTQNCISNNSKIVVSQIDNTTYIGTCINTSNVFFFSLQSNYTETILDLSTYNMTTPINGLILNPILEIQGVSQVGWNVFLLTNGGTQTYSCNFDPLNPDNFTYLNSSQFSVQFKLLIQKLWSEESSLLQVKIQKLLDHIGPQVNEMFPGKIDSIYIDSLDNVYIQSINDNNLTFLNVYNWEKIQMLNASFYGKVLLYNQREFLVEGYQNKSDFSIMYITLPMISVAASDVVNNTYTVSIPCNDSINNLTIQYLLFISNIDYPTSFTFQLVQPILSSNLSIFTFQLQNFFTVFGPGYTVYLKGPDVLQATLLDASIISMSTYVLSIVEIIVAQSTANSIFRSSSITYTTQDGVYIYSGSKIRDTKIGSRPCGIKYNLRGLKISDSQTIYYGYVDNSRSYLTNCLCPTNKYDFKQCQTIEKSALRRKIMKIPQKLSLRLDKLEKLELLKGYNYDDVDYSDQLPSDYGSYISDRLFTIVDQNLLVTLYNNNSAILSNFWTKQYYGIVTLQCNQLKQLVGVLYIKDFMDPSLYLFCEESEYLYQYKIRLNQFMFQRIIPLYGFLTRSDSSKLLVGVNYIFIEVSVNQNPNQNSTVNVDPRNPHCCVLRIDPNVDTVSSIKEVMFAKFIQQVYQYSGIDVAYYQGSQVTDDDSFLKIYLDQTWMALNQTSAQSQIQTYNFQVVFASINYNLASQFSANITYNMTTMGLFQNVQPLNSVILLDEITSPILPQIYSKTVYFNYSGIQGPISKSNIKSSDTPEMIQDVQLNEVIVQRKILGNVGNTYLKIFTPMEGKSNTTFDNSVILIGSKQVLVYLKNFNDQEMYLVSSYALKYPNCKYFTYQVLNTTSIQFVSECQVPQFTLEIPILTLSLTIVNSTYASLGASLILGSVNVRLSGMKTIVFQNTTYVLGIDEGPMQSLTGKLRYCSSKGNCSVLYSSSKQYFLLYYDVYAYDVNEFVVATLDFQYIQVWVNPQLSSNTTSSNQTIPCNYTIYIPSFLNEDISIISLINATSTSFTAILSGTQAYYEVVFTYSTQQTTINTIFQRYGNCELFDRFPVNVLLDKQGNVEALVAECNQNEDILRLQTYERINSTSIVIYTGYLQFYSKYGPTSYLATSKIPAFNPIRLLELSNTMINKLFLLYRNEKEQIKLVYQQIDGILADTYVHLQPSISVNLSPLTTNLKFPTLYFQIQNNFYSINYTITTKPAPIETLTSVELACFVVFIACNVFNLIVMVFYWIYNRKRQPRRPTQNQSILAKSWDEDHTQRTFRDFKDKIKERLSGLTIVSRKSYTRKQTEIQLFTRRSQ